MKKKETINEAIERMGNKIAKKSRRTRKLDETKQPRWSASLKEAMGIVTQRLAEIEKRMAAPHGDIEELRATIDRYEANTRKVLVTMQQQIEKVQSEAHTRIAGVETTLEAKERQSVLDSIPQYDAPPQFNGRIENRRVETAITRLIGMSELIQQLIQNRISILPENSTNREFKRAIEAAKIIWLTDEDIG